MLHRFIDDIHTVSDMLDATAPRETAAVLRASLDELAADVAHARAAGPLDAHIVDAAVLFDAVQDVRRLAGVLDPDLRAVAERVDRLLKDITAAVADDLSAAALDDATGETPAAAPPAFEPRASS